MTTKFDRQGAILRLVQERSLSTQEEVAEALRDVGHEVVQGTVSRDIAQLGLVKVRDGSGRLVVRAQRLVGRLHVAVEDDGAGLPDTFDLDGSTSLGLSIVRTLVESELGGQLEIGPATVKGTRVDLDIPLS